MLTFWTVMYFKYSMMTRDVFQIQHDDPWCISNTTRWIIHRVSSSLNTTRLEQSKTSTSMIYIYIIYI
jgi:hypothetical protein